VTPGSEPRHAAHETVEERLAEEVVEELDLHPAPEARQDEDGEEPLPSMSEQIAEQLGGVRGLVESSVPVLAFVLFNVLLGDAVLGLDKKPALYWALAGSIASALAIGAVRLAGKQSVRHAVNGLFGIALGAFFAWRTGKAENFFLPGILITFGQAAVLLISMVVGRPLIGYFWGVMANKGLQDWFANKRLFRTFQWLTGVWVVSLCVRAGIQLVLYLQHEATAIGVVRILISWPIYAATFAYSAWAIHRVTSAQKAAGDEQETPV
jgi:hypothetical protein